MRQNCYIHIFCTLSTLFGGCSILESLHIPAQYSAEDNQSSEDKSILQLVLCFSKGIVRNQPYSSNGQIPVATAGGHLNPIPSLRREQVIARKPLILLHRLDLETPPRWIFQTSKFFFLHLKPWFKPILEAFHLVLPSETNHSCLVSLRKSRKTKKNQNNFCSPAFSNNFQLRNISILSYYMEEGGLAERLLCSNMQVHTQLVQLPSKASSISTTCHCPEGLNKQAQHAQNRAAGYKNLQPAPKYRKKN